MARLAYLLLPLLAAAQQVCVLRQEGRVPAVGPVCNASDFAQSFNCTCTGFDRLSVPQLLARSTITAGTAALAWWSMSFDSALYTVSYEIALAATLLNATTNQALISSMPLLPVRDADFSLAMEYSPSETETQLAARADESVTFAGGWIPCTVTPVQAVQLQTFPEDGYAIVNVSWAVPNGTACKYLTYDIITNKTVIAADIDGCTSFALVNLTLACKLRAIFVNASFLYPDGSRGPSCNASAATAVIVADPPSPPQDIAVNLVTPNILYTRWHEPAYSGGCGPYLGYTAEIVEASTGTVLLRQGFEYFNDNNAYTSLTFNASAAYVLRMQTSAPSGVSTFAAVPFSGQLGQRCRVLVNGRLAETVTRIQDFCQSPVCMLETTCSGMNPDFLPQIQVSAGSQTPNNASFLSWSVINTDPATAVTYAINGSWGTGFADVTTKNVSQVVGIDPGQEPFVNGVVGYDNPAFPPDATVNFTLLWMPCHVSGLVATPRASRDKETPVSLRWTLPFGNELLCPLLQYAFFSQNASGTIELGTVSGCVNSSTVTLLTRCVPYNVTLQTYFIDGNGNRLALCPSNPAPALVSLQVPPAEPVLLDVRAVSLTLVTATWAEQDWGDCERGSFSITIVDHFNGDVIFSGTADPDTNSTEVTLQLRTGGQYEFSLQAHSTAGPSEIKTQLFRAPGDPSSPSGSGLTAGALVGVILGSLAFLGIVIVAVWYGPDWYRRRGFQVM
eukprot:m.12751 g.12751  ORF g.12751 m.12751 type:complete len:731 (-) comp2753_c0_seq1:142-2334(-)